MTPDQILAVLRDAEGFPVSTAAVADGVGAPRGSTRAVAVLRRLNMLKVGGAVELIQVPDMRSLYWRRGDSPDPTQEGTCE